VTVRRRDLTSLRNESSSDVERGSARNVASIHPARHDTSDPWDDDEFPPEQPWHRESQEAGLEVNRQVGGRADNFDERLEKVRIRQIYNWRSQKVYTTFSDHQPLFRTS